jgi:hypothetical protein
MSAPTNHILRDMNQNENVTSYLHKTRFNIILHCAILFRAAVCYSVPDFTRNPEHMMLLKTK